MLDRKIKIFFLQICLAVWAISYSLLKSQKSTKATAMVVLVVMTPLKNIMKDCQNSPKDEKQ